MHFCSFSYSQLPRGKMQSATMTTVFRLLSKEICLSTGFTECFSYLCQGTSSIAKAHLIVVPRHFKNMEVWSDFENP